MFRFVLPAVIGFVLTAPGVRADEAKSVNLEDLKHAVTKAVQRGENIGAVVDTLAAFEKALAKFASKPGEAPPELAALRDAVEAVAKKGENVEAISKELGLIEKTLTGREYERPKPPEPKLEPVPPLPNRRGIVINGGNGVVINGNRVVVGDGFKGRVTINGAGGKFDSTSITIAAGDFTIKARKGDVTYLIGGEVNGDVALILIQEGDKRSEFDSVKKVPKEHLDTVEELLRMVNR